MPLWFLIIVEVNIIVTINGHFIKFPMKNALIDRIYVITCQMLLLSTQLNIWFK